MKNVLLITYCWPPDASVGANRPVKLTRHLAAMNIRPTVLTVKERYYSSAHGGTSTATCPVLRTRMLGNPTSWYALMKRWGYALAGRRKQFAQEALIWNPQNPIISGEPFVSRFKRVLLSLLHTPDEVQGWIPYATFAALREVWANRIDCVITSGPPFSAHLIGLIVKAICGVPWVAEFRDPWFGNDQKSVNSKSGVAAALDRRLESAVVRAADRVVCVTPAMTKTYRRRYPAAHPSKWLTITNGFDAEEFESLCSVSRSPKFTISYVGNFFYTRSPATLLRALGELISEGAVDRQDLAIRFIGSCQFAGGKPVSEMVADANLADVVEIVKPVPRREALIEMMRSHVLLLLANDQPLQIPAKTFEYVGAGGHILALAEPGATADLIGEISGSAVCELNDVAAIKRAIRSWYDEFKSARVEGARRVPAVEKYEWNNLARAYAVALEECWSGRNAARPQAPIATPSVERLD